MKNSELLRMIQDNNWRITSTYSNPPSIKVTTEKGPINIEVSSWAQDVTIVRVICRALNQVEYIRQSLNLARDRVFVKV